MKDCRRGNFLFAIQIGPPFLNRGPRVSESQKMHAEKRFNFLASMVGMFGHSGVQNLVFGPMQAKLIRVLHCFRGLFLPPRMQNPPQHPQLPTAPLANDMGTPRGTISEGLADALAQEKG